MAVYDVKDKNSESDNSSTSPIDEAAKEQRAYKAADIERREQLAREAKDEAKQNPKEASNDELNNLEQNKTSTEGSVAPETEDSDEDSLYNYHPESKKGFSFKAKTGGKSKKKLFAILGIGGGISLFIIIMIIIFVIGLFKIPDLAQHILEYQFARSSRMLNEEGLQLTTEKMAYDAADTATQGQIDKIFGDGSVWSKIKSLNPENMIENLGQQGVVKLNYSAGKILGVNQKLTSLDIGGENIDVSPVTANNFTKALHPIDTFTSGPKVAAQVSNALDNVLADDTGIIARAAVENSIRQALGIGLLAWTAGDLINYLNKTPTQADAVQELQAFDAIEHGDSAVGSIVKPLDDAIKSADNQLKQDVSNPKTDAELAANGGRDEAVNAILASAAANVGSSSIWKSINPLSIALPICIIYDGSLENQNASDSIDEQDNQSQRTFYYLESAADQEKYGTTNAEAVGALDSKNWRYHPGQR